MKKDSCGGNRGSSSGRMLVWGIILIALIIASLSGCVLANNEVVVLAQNGR